MNIKITTGHSPTGQPPGTEDDKVRVLHRVTPFREWPEVADPVEPLMSVAILDTESTGLDPKHDVVIEIAIAFVVVDAMGQIVRIESAGKSLQDPCVPLSPKIVQLTGLTDEMLAGRNINTAHIAKRLNEMDAICAHNSLASMIEGLSRDCCQILMQNHGSAPCAIAIGLAGVLTGPRPIIF